MAKAVKNIKVNQKLDVYFAFVICDLSMFSWRHVKNQPMNPSTVAFAASARPQIISFALCVCRHQNIRVQVTVQNLRTGECFQVLACWRKWRHQCYKAKTLEIEKWEIAFGIKNKIKYASLVIWRNPHGQQVSLKLIWVHNKYDPVIQAWYPKLRVPVLIRLSWHSKELTILLLTVGQSVRSCVTLCYTKPQDKSQYEKKLRLRTGCRLQEICQTQAAPHMW